MLAVNGLGGKVPASQAWLYLYARRALMVSRAQTSLEKNFDVDSTETKVDDGNNISSYPGPAL